MTLWWSHIDFCHCRLRYAATTAMIGLSILWCCPSVIYRLMFLVVLFLAAYRDAIHGQTMIRISVASTRSNFDIFHKVFTSWLEMASWSIIKPVSHNLLHIQSSSTRQQFLSKDQIRFETVATFRKSPTQVANRYFILWSWIRGPMLYEPLASIDRTMTLHFLPSLLLANWFFYSNSIICYLFKTVI